MKLWREGIVRAVLALGLGSSVGCGGDDGGPSDRGDLELSWANAPNAALQGLADAMEEGFGEVADEFNDTFALPRDLPVKHTRCGEINAFYDPETGELTMCYELLDLIAANAEQAAETDEDFAKSLVGTWMFVFFHELGHGLIHQYELPITGREEDSVDNFSTVLLIEGGQAEAALSAAAFWGSQEMGELDQTSFADEHSLNAQRFFNILCLVYGSDPAKYAGLVTEGYLPESRAVRCPAEYQTQRRSWFTLLEPWTK